jgi:opacity protein-like surface antigen
VEPKLPNGVARIRVHTLSRRRLLLAAVALVFCASSAQAQQKVERKIPLGIEGALRIANMVGSVVVHGWNKDTVMVRGTLGAGDKFYMGGSYTGAKMFVEAVNDRDPKPTRLEVWVPSRVRLWIKTATASIDVNDVNGGLDLYVVSGTIDVRGNPRELNAEAIDGDIHVIGSPSWVRAKTATGTITFQGVSSDLALSTVSGPIKVDGGVFERTKIETVTGNITFTGRLDRSGVFDFDTHSGNIEIGIPEKTGISVSAVTIAGTITNNLSKHPPIPGRFGRGAELTMELSGGGARVVVRTFKGPVTFRRPQ